jgi:DnaJ-class molecular chaperone
MYALTDSYDIDHDRNHDRKVKIRAERKNLFANTKPCDRCEGFGTLIAPYGEEACYCCNGLGMVKILSIVK